MHAVEDYSAWRLTYNEFDASRQQYGIVGDAVSAHVDDPDRLVVYHRANDVEALRAFVDSKELKEEMQAAGVIGEPDIRFIEIVEFANY